MTCPDVIQSAYGTKYPLVSTHAPIVRGDPLSITIFRKRKLSDGTKEAIDITDTFWRAQVRENPDGPELTAFLIDVIDGPTGQLLMELTGDQTAQLPLVVGWDLEQVTGSGVTLQTVWQVNWAPVLPDWTRA